MKKSLDGGGNFIIRKSPNTQLSGEIAQIRKSSTACGVMPVEGFGLQHRCFTARQDCRAAWESKQRGGQADGEAVLCVCSTCASWLHFCMSYPFCSLCVCCILIAVLHVSLWLQELLPGWRCINHRFYRVAGCDFLLLPPQNHTHNAHMSNTCGPPGGGEKCIFSLGLMRSCLVGGGRPFPMSPYTQNHTLKLLFHLNGKQKDVVFYTPHAWTCA